MTTSLLLAVVATAVLVAGWGLLFGLLAELPQVRARSWLIAAVGLAVGIAACGAWHGVPATRVICPFVIVLGCQPLWRLPRRSRGTASDSASGPTP